MLVTKSSEYALILVAHLAFNKTDNLTKTSEVSDTYDFSYMYLTIIVKQLVKADIIISKRGLNGGLKLARPAKAISMLEVIETIDGPLDSNLDTVHYANKNPFGHKIDKIYMDTCKKAKKILENAKLSQIIKKSALKSKANTAKTKSKKVIEIKSVPHKDNISKELLEQIENSKKERRQEHINTKEKRGRRRIYTKENMACIYELIKIGKTNDESANICDYTSGKAVGQAVRLHEKHTK